MATDTPKRITVSLTPYLNPQFTGPGCSLPRSVYKVLRVQNAVRPALGDFLQESEVEKLIADPNTIVNIHQDAP